MTDTIGAALRRGAELLAAAGIDGAPGEARRLLAHALGEPPSALVDRSRVVETGSLKALIARRAAREPMSYITGFQGFWTLDLTVTPAVLIPRADSETLIEAALACFSERGQVRRVLDLGTGSGCLLLATLSEFGGAVGIGVDRSAPAARLARDNAKRCDLAPRAAFVVGCWAESLDGAFDLVLCNPPYIESDALPGLMPEVSRHEPRAALDGGRDGLAAYRAILADLPRVLAAAGAAVLEIGAGQADAVADLAVVSGLRVETIRPDLGGHPRAVVLRHAKKPFGTTGQLR